MFRNFYDKLSERGKDTRLAVEPKAISNLSDPRCLLGRVETSRCRDRRSIQRYVLLRWNKHKQRRTILNSVKTY